MSKPKVPDDQRIRWKSLGGNERQGHCPALERFGERAAIYIDYYTYGQDRSKWRWAIRCTACIATGSQSADLFDPEGDIDAAKAHAQAQVPAWIAAAREWRAQRKVEEAQRKAQLRADMARQEETRQMVADAQRLARDIKSRAPGKYVDDGVRLAELVLQLAERKALVAL